MILNIANVNDKENSREFKMINAINSDGKKDYDLEEVESTAPHILIALVHRCIVGSRHLKARVKASQEDLESSCLDILEDIISTLTRAKTACRDVLGDEGKIAVRPPA